MRDLRQLEKYRTIGQPNRPEEMQYGGAFRVVHKGNVLRIIASNDAGWDHVSISRMTACPSWEDMEFVKRMFFEEGELCWQYHVPVGDHININPHVLHIWRKHDFEMPLPPRWMV